MRRRGVARRRGPVRDEILHARARDAGWAELAQAAGGLGLGHVGRHPVEDEAAAGVFWGPGVRVDHDDGVLPGIIGDGLVKVGVERKLRLLLGYCSMVLVCDEVCELHRLT